MSTNQTAAIASPAEFIPSLLKLLRDMVAERRNGYHEADALILENLKKGERRRGKAKLKLSKEKLVEHMEAVEIRRHMHRQLQVLVPVLNRIVSVSQLPVGATEAFDKALSPIRTKLAAYAFGTGSLETYEKPVAGLLITAFPSVLAPAPGEEPKSASLAKEPKVDERRLKLFNKITSSGILDGREVEQLRVIFWGK